MKEFDILQELEKLNDDIELGFLRDLKQQTPDELHSRIMNSIRQEAMSVDEHRDTPIVKTRNRFNYRKYVTFTAAAAVLVVAFLGGASGLFKNNTPTKNVGPNTFASKPNSDPSKQSPSGNQIVATDVTTLDNPGVRDNTTQVPKNTPTLYNNTATGNDNTKSTPRKTIVASKDKPSGSVSFKQRRDTGTNQDPAFATLADPAKKPTSTDHDSNNNPTVIANDQSNPSKTPETVADNKDLPSLIQDNPSKIGIDSTTAYLDSIVNYEVSLNMSQTFIIQYIKEKGTMISSSNNVYRLSKTDYDDLSIILEQNGISCTKVNDLMDKTVFIKMILN